MPPSSVRRSRRSALLIAASIVSLAGLASLTSCAADPPIVVHTARVGQTSEVEMGKTARFDRIAKPEHEGHHPGYFTIRNQTEWDLFFADVPGHPLSHDVDFGKDIVLAAYASEADVVALRVNQAVEAERGVHLYLSKVMPGEGCPTTTKHLAYDLVTIDRSEKPVHLHVDSERGDACGPQRAPQASVACRVPPSTQWSEKIVAELGASVECQAKVEPGVRPVVDRTLRFQEIAKGSGAKVKFAQGGLYGKFTVDAIGKFVVHVEATDDGQRKGEATAIVDVAPPTADTYAEIAWTRYTAQDDLETFPRVDLHIVETTPPPPAAPAPTATATAGATAPNAATGGANATHATVGSSASSAPAAAGASTAPSATGASSGASSAGASSAAPKPTATKLPKAPAPKPRPAPSRKDCSYESIDKPAYCQVTKWGVTTLTRMKGDTPGRYALSVRYQDERVDKGPMLCVRIFSKGAFTSEACDPAARKPGAVWEVGVVDEATGQPVLPAVAAAPPPASPPAPPPSPAAPVLPASPALAPRAPTTGVPPKK